uniref:Uncharacterized protein n=1 Tax=Roseihalotalea indica TaxID=2867963 RepID=A0AA49JG97_9BACT|nr:hypothetical protein K4G66_27415 [Tunicatimonas sp. TK19036]
MSRQETNDLKQRILKLGLHKFEEEALYDQVKKAINRPKTVTPRPRRYKEKTPLYLPRLS